MAAFGSGHNWADTFLGRDFASQWSVAPSQRGFEGLYNLNEIPALYAPLEKLRGLKAKDDALKAKELKGLGLDIDKIKPAHIFGSTIDMYSNMISKTTRELYDMQQGRSSAQLSLDQGYKQRKMDMDVLTKNAQTYITTASDKFREDSKLVAANRKAMTPINTKEAAEWMDAVENGHKYPVAPDKPFTFVKKFIDIPWTQEAQTTVKKYLKAEIPPQLVTSAGGYGYGSVKTIDGVPAMIFHSSGRITKSNNANVLRRIGNYANGLMTDNTVNKTFANEYVSEHSGFNSIYDLSLYLKDKIKLPGATVGHYLEIIQNNVLDNKSMADIYGIIEKSIGTDVPVLKEMATNAAGQSKMVNVVDKDGNQVYDVTDKKKPLQEKKPILPEDYAILLAQREHTDKFSSETSGGSASVKVLEDGGGGGSRISDYNDNVINGLFDVGHYSTKQPMSQLSMTGKGEGKEKQDFQLINKHAKSMTAESVLRDDAQRLAFDYMKDWGASTLTMKKGAKDNYGRVALPAKILNQEELTYYDNKRPMTIAKDYYLGNDLDNGAFVLAHVDNKEVPIYLDDSKNPANLKLGDWAKRVINDEVPKEIEFNTYGYNNTTTDNEKRKVVIKPISFASVGVSIPIDGEKAENFAEQLQKAGLIDIPNWTGINAWLDEGHLRDRLNGEIIEVNGAKRLAFELLVPIIDPEKLSTQLQDIKIQKKYLRDVPKTPNN